MILGLSEEEFFEKGHRACAGCGAAIAMRHALKASGKNTIVVMATGCMEVVSSPYPETAWKVPWIHGAFENAAAIASGVDKALLKLGKRDQVNVLAIGGDGACYIPKTKILTLDGFKNVEELKKKEIIWSINPKTLEMEQTPIIKMHKYNYYGEILSVNHNFVHFDVSLNHNIPHFDKIDKGLKFSKAYELLDYGRSERMNIITGGLRWKRRKKKNFYLPKLKSRHKFSSKTRELEKINMDIWLEFLGYWISEGHLGKRSSNREFYNIFISPTHPKNRKKIQSCLEKSPFNFWYSKDRFIISNQQLWTYLNRFRGAKNKQIPKEIKDLNIDQLKILFDALILGDGTKLKYKKSTGFAYTTISRKLKDDMIEIALKLGYRTHLDTRKRKDRYEYLIVISTYKPTTLANLRRKHISTYTYKGNIYCPELKKNHILIIEKDGRISLNMNSFDIGFQALSGMLERGHKVCYLCYDNGAYSNTGIQRSGATPKYASTTTSPAGKKIHGKQEFKKPMPLIVAAHNVYVATANIAYPHDFISKVKKALSIKGPSYIQIFTPCVIGWKYPSELTVNIAKLAFEAKITPLYEIENGILKFTKHPANPKPVLDYLKPQGRFKHLNELEVKEVQEHVNSEYEKLLNLEKYKIKI